MRFARAKALSLIGARAADDSRNLLPNAFLDLNIVEGINRHAGADAALADLLDIANGNTPRTVKDAAGDDVAFPGNTLPVTDAGLYVSNDATFEHRDLVNIDDAAAAEIIAALGGEGITIFAEWVQAAPDTGDHRIVTFHSADEAQFLTFTSNGNWAGTISNTWGIGPIGASRAGEGSIVRMAARIKNGEATVITSVADPVFATWGPVTPSGHFAVSTDPAAIGDFAGGKIWVGSNKYDQFMGTPIRRLAFSLSRRPDAELLAWVQGTTNPGYASLRFINQLLNASASAMTLLGINMHLRQAWLDQDVPASVNLAAADMLDVDAVRLDAGWDAIEPVVGQPYDFSRYAELVDGLIAAGKKVVLMFGYGHFFHTGSHLVPPTTGPQITAYCNAAVALMQRFPQAILEPMNEPNLAEFWNSAVNPGQYATLLMAVGSAVKTALPGVRIISAGISSRNWPDPLTYIADFIAAMTDTSNIDGWSFHPYLIPDGNVLVPEYLKQMCAAVFAVMTGKEKWNTESGYPLHWVGMDPVKQAKNRVRGYLASVVAGLYAHIDYDAIDDGDPASAPENPELTYGALDHLYNPKPSATAIQRMAAIKAGTTTYSVDRIPGFDLTAVTFNRSGGKTIALVAEHLGINLVHDIGDYVAVSAADALGNPIPVKPLGGNVIKVAVNPANSPVFVNVETPAVLPRLPINATVVAIGDSLVDWGSSYVANDHLRIASNGFVSQMLARSGARLKYGFASNKGIYGQTSAEVLARFAADTEGFDAIIISVGSNSFRFDVTAASVRADLDAMLAIAAGRGQFVFVKAVEPRDVLVGSKETQRLLYNAGLSSIVTDKVKIFGVHPDFTVATSTYDGTHFNTVGAEQEGSLGAVLLDAAVEPGTVLFTDAADPANIIPNGLFTGNLGLKTGVATGQVVGLGGFPSISNYAVIGDNAGGATVDCSVVAGEHGNKQRIQIGGTKSGNGKNVAFQCAILTAPFTPEMATSDVFDATLRVEIAAGSAHVLGVMLEVTLIGSGAQFAAQNFATVASPMGAGAADLVLRVPLQLTSTTPLQIDWRVLVMLEDGDVSPVADIMLSQAGIRKEA